MLPTEPSRHEIIVAQIRILLSVDTVAIQPGSGKNSKIQVTGRVYVGGLAGVNAGTITDCSITGQVGDTQSGYGYVGGIVGYNYGGALTNCAAKVTVLGNHPEGRSVAGRFGSPKRRCQRKIAENIFILLLFDRQVRNLG